VAFIVGSIGSDGADRDGPPMEPCCARPVNAMRPPRKVA